MDFQCRAFKWPSRVDRVENSFQRTAATDQPAGAHATCEMEKGGGRAAGEFSETPPLLFAEQENEVNFFQEKKSKI